MATRNSSISSPATPEAVRAAPIYLVFATRIPGRFESLVKPLATFMKQPDAGIRARLTGTLPRLLRVTRDREAAVATLAFLRSRGVAATACDAGAIHESENATSLRESSFVSSGMVGEDRDGNRCSLAFDDALCLLPAFPGRYVLYLFARSGGRPWILREVGVSHYPASRQRRPHEDFVRRTHDLQRALPHAIYDERLLTMDLETQCTLLREGEVEQSSDRPSQESRVTRSSWRGLRKTKPGYISPELSEGAQLRVTLDVMAHIIALSYASGHF